MNTGDTFLLEQVAIGRHLFLVISDPDADQSKVVIVPVATRRPYHPKDCLLQPGDHQFIRHESTVMFSRARIVDQDYLIRWGKSRDPLTTDILDRILLAASSSIDLPIAIESMLREQGLIP